MPLSMDLTSSFDPDSILKFKNLKRWNVERVWHSECCDSMIGCPGWRLCGSCFGSVPEILGAPIDSHSEYLGEMFELPDECH